MPGSCLARRRVAGINAAVIAGSAVPTLRRYCRRWLRRVTAMSADSMVGPLVQVGDNPLHCPGCACESGYPSDEAMAAIAAACTCPGCMTAGKCVEEQDDENSWREVETDELDH